MDFIQKMYREVQDLRRQVNLMRKGLVRLGKVHSVNTTTCTVVIEFAGEDSANSPPVPWLQRSTEHRPPAVGDHAILIDPSLGSGAGLAITGWPSAVKISPGVATSDHTLYAGLAAAKVISPDIQLSATGLPLQPFVRGTDLMTYLDALHTAISAALTAIGSGYGTPAAANFALALTALNTAKAAALSSVIKGE